MTEAWELFSEAVAKILEAKTLYKLAIENVTVQKQKEKKKTKHEIMHKRRQVFGGNQTQSVENKKYKKQFFNQSRSSESV